MADDYTPPPPMDPRLVSLLCGLSADDLVEAPRPYFVALAVHALITVESDVTRTTGMRIALTTRGRYIVDAALAASGVDVHKAGA